MEAIAAGPEVEVFRVVIIPFPFWFGWARRRNVG